MWGRGLKLIHKGNSFVLAVSPPMWGRGLKHLQELLLAEQGGVAPHVGAWIETDSTDTAKFAKMSPPMWGRGLKQNRGAGYKDTK